ncbi:hypothetical protein CC80DRAFT_501548 [Byssothecium circinans]|uniref:Uncharacterized protein n=1 Tax=Byssothecium circinans TaxID=147558 RepID=A0A6A5U5X9_9PLEO|nr:hypothetical protein CC80DRAFT_501548 [Byssothecium circinans]
MTDGLKKTGGNVNWTSHQKIIETGKMYEWINGNWVKHMLNLAAPPKIWIVDQIGHRELLWDTPSWTRSRTLPLFCQGQQLLDANYNVVAKGRTTCPCEVARHTGNTIVHGFTLGEDSTAVFYYVREGIWGSMPPKPKSKGLLTVEGEEEEGPENKIKPPAESMDVGPRPRKVIRHEKRQPKLSLPTKPPHGLSHHPEQ